MIFVKFCVCWEFKSDFKFRNKTLTLIKSSINCFITGSNWGWENFICSRNCWRLINLWGHYKSYICFIASL